MEGSPPRHKARPPSPGSGPQPSLDSLPSEILENIVARLTVRQAVRTSAVSRAWLHCWESSPGLLFCWGRGETHHAAVSAVLARYACPIRRFRYGWILTEVSAHTDEWLVLLAGRRVESLALCWEYIHVDFHTLHSAIFSCRELTDLELEHCCLPAAPSGFSGFTNLTMLTLSSVGLPEHGEKTLEAMISLAPLLRFLELKNVWIDGDELEEWVIRAPNLKDLTIESDDDYLWQIEELPSLQTVTINVDDDSIDPDFVQLLTCFAQVSMLDLHMPSAEDNALEGLSCSFQK